MTPPVLGLPVRWASSFDWRLIGSLAPRRLGRVIAARAGAHVVGLEAASGAVVWKHTVAEGRLDGFVFEVCGDVAITDWRDDVSKRGHLVAVDAAGVRRWDVELVAGVGDATVKLDERSLAAAVLGEAWEIVVVDAEGRLARTPLPYPGAKLARAAGGEWVVGSSGLARGKPSLYALTDGVARVVDDVAPQVMRLVPAGADVITVERTGDQHEVVVRGAELRARWRRAIASDVVASTAGQVWVVVGDREHPAPAALDLATGEVRWQGPPLPALAERATASAELVLIGHEAGAVLLTASGTVLGDHEGSVGRLDATGDAVYLFVDKAVVCLERP